MLPRVSECPFTSRPLLPARCQALLACYQFFWLLLDDLAPRNSTLYWVHSAIGSYLTIAVLSNYLSCVIAGPGKLPPVPGASDSDRVGDQEQGGSFRSAAQHPWAERTPQASEGMTWRQARFAPGWSRYSDAELGNAGAAEGTADGALQTQVNFCRRCERDRPERSHHCKYCARCVPRMDHHCPWMASCVGAENYRFFVLTLFWVTVTCYYGVVITRHRMWIELRAQLSSPHFGASIKRAAVNVLYARMQDLDLPTIATDLVSDAVFANRFCFLTAMVLGLPVNFLLIFHLLLIYRGQTTIEYQMHRREAYQDHKAGKPSLVPWRSRYSHSSGSFRRDLQQVFGTPIALVLLPACGSLVSWHWACQATLGTTALPLGPKPQEGIV